MIVLLHFKGETRENRQFVLGNVETDITNSG
jgi:hypothetical protein